MQFQSEKVEHDLKKSFDAGDVGESSDNSEEEDDDEDVDDESSDSPSR